MKFKCNKDCVLDGRTIKANVTVVESQADLSCYRTGWYKVAEEAPEAPVKPRVNKVKK